MLKKRIIPTLLLRNGRMVKGVNFDQYRDVGDPIYASRVYNSQYVDELIFLDIDATNEKRACNHQIIERVSKECFMPLAIGGGIQSLEEIQILLRSGADKVLINTAAYLDLEFIKRAVNRFGSQCIVIGIDVKKNSDQKYTLYSNSGKVEQEITLENHIMMMDSLGVGELFINNISRDGEMIGYDLELINKVTSLVQLPVIACGGAGNLQHLVEGFKMSDVSALAMASIYHFGDNNPIRARAHLINHDIDIKIV